MTPSALDPWLCYGDTVRCQPNTHWSLMRARLGWVAAGREGVSAWLCHHGAPRPLPPMRYHTSAGPGGCAGRQRPRAWQQCCPGTPQGVLTAPTLGHTDLNLHPRCCFHCPQRHTGVQEAKGSFLWGLLLPFSPSTQPPTCAKRGYFRKLCRCSGSDGAETVTAAATQQAGWTASHGADREPAVA